MHILCTICSDLVNQAESIYVTKCGHVFHHNCLAKWIARSKSCPQCRNKVTDRCMFRLYPTISNENTVEDVTTLQSRLDDAQLQLREQKTLFRDREECLISLQTELRKNEELLKVCEKKLVTRESAVAALKEQLQYVKIQNKETVRLKEENESLKKNIQTMNGLQKVLNATSEEVEMMLQGYSDVRTIATFATALKRALCESESKKTESRDRLQQVKQQLAAEKSTVAELQAKLRSAEEQIWELRKEKSQEQEKRRETAIQKIGGKDADIETLDAIKLNRIESPVATTANNVTFITRQPQLKFPKTFWHYWQNQNRACYSPEKSSEDEFNCARLLNESETTLVNSIETSDSPYLRLKQSNLALVALQRRHPTSDLDRNLKPTEFALLNSAKTSLFKKSHSFSTSGLKHSIFHKKKQANVDLERYEQVSELDVSYDGLGGHSKPTVFPVPNTKPVIKGIPKISSKHKLKRPNTSGAQDIEKMLKKVKKDAGLDC